MLVIGGIGMKIENNQYQKYVSQINMDVANHNAAKREEKTESKRDTVEISKEAQALEKTEARELKSSSKGITITTDGNTINVSFKNTAYLYGAVMRGYIDIGNERFILDDDTKKRLTDTADKLHEQQEQAIMIATAEHNLMVAQQQAEVWSQAAKDEARIMKIASVIMHGGKVSPEDENKLAQWDLGLYMMAKQAAMMQKQKGKQEELSPEEEETKKSSDGDDTIDSPLNHLSTYTIDMTIESNNGQMSVTNIATTEQPANANI